MESLLKAIEICGGSQAGLANNLNDGLAWGLLPIFFAANGLHVATIGILAAIYPAVWGLGQLVTGALSDRIGRKWLIASGMILQAVALGLIALTRSFAGWAPEAALLGVGTAMVYPTLIAAVSDASQPRDRARMVGVYRFWRDSGFVLGALIAGIGADATSPKTAILIVAAATFHRAGETGVAEIQEAYRVLTPLLGVTGASAVFAFALLASGQNSTLTGTLAGQIVMEGFLDIRLRPWLRRLITRMIAIVPAALTAIFFGEHGTAQLLILSQVILSLQLSFAVFPLVRFTSDRLKMGELVNPRWLTVLAYVVAFAIAGSNTWLLVKMIS